MAQLIVRNIEQDVKKRLAQRARAHGHSMEEEVRRILREAVGEEARPSHEPGLGTQLARHFEEHGLSGIELPEMQRQEAKPALFD
jgi:plasmid stability protein